jgi:hypothetical protein
MAAAAAGWQAACADRELFAAAWQQEAAAAAAAHAGHTLFLQRIRAPGTGEPAEDLVPHANWSCPTTAPFCWIQNLLYIDLTRMHMEVAAMVWSCSVTRSHQQWSRWSTFWEPNTMWQWTALQRGYPAEGNSGLTDFRKFCNNSIASVIELSVYRNQEFG